MTFQLRRCPIFEIHAEYDADTPNHRTAHAKTPSDATFWLEAAGVVKVKHRYVGAQVVPQICAQNVFKSLTVTFHFFYIFQEASEAGISKAPNISALRQAIEDESRRQNGPSMMPSASGTSAPASSMSLHPSPPLGTQPDGYPPGMHQAATSKSGGSVSAMPYGAGLESNSTPSSSDELGQRLGPSLSRSASTTSSNATGAYFAYSADGTRESSPSASTGSESSSEPRWAPLPLQGATTAPFVPQAFATAGDDMFQYIHTTPTHQEPPQQQQQSSLENSVSGQHQQQPQQQQADYFPDSYGLPPATGAPPDTAFYASYQHSSLPL